MSHTIRKYPASFELLDQRQFALDLLARLLGMAAVALARALVRALAQEANPWSRLRARDSAEIRSPDRPA